MKTTPAEILEFLACFTYAKTTKRTYTDILTHLVTETDPASLNAADLLKFCQRKTWKNSRQCVALACSQKYIRWKYGDNHVALKAKIKRVIGKPQRALDEDTTLKLLASFDRYTAKGARDLAIASLALDTGLREAELCRLEMADTNLKKCALEVIVKGGHWEAAIFTEETSAHLEHWLAYRKAAPGTTTVFVNIQTGETLTPEGLYTIANEWGKNIDIELSPHDLRRTFTVMATELGAPERILMDGGRWTNSAMIKRYTRTLRLEAMRPYLPGKKLHR